MEAMNASADFKALRNRRPVGICVWAHPKLRSFSTPTRVSPAMTNRKMLYGLQRGGLAKGNDGLEGKRSTRYAVYSHCGDDDVRKSKSRCL